MMMETPRPRDGRHRVQLWMACVLCTFGLALLGAAFFTSPPGEIHSSVLVAYAGALFGIDYHYRGR